MTSRFYVTTPIYYINDVPHLGSAYTTIAADVLARYHRMRGHETRFLTGTDEHGLKVLRVAEAQGIAPGAYADRLAPMFEKAFRALGCSFDDFIRTTEERHIKGAQAIWRTIQDKGDLYLGHYEGLYCVGCEAYYTEKDLEQPGNICPIHKTPVESVKEESYFFRLSKYEKPLLDLYASRPDFVQPTSRRNEVESFVSGGLQDLSVSRTTFNWGIPVPGDERHIMYIWFDALANYYTALAADQKEFFPSCVHMMGKDILRFHAVYWPAFLMAAGLPLPRQVFAHGFLTYGGQKMSKSLRNTVSPVELANAVSAEVGVDVVRYCLMRAISFGLDGDFSIQDVLTRYTSELGNGLGNLVKRILPFSGFTKSAPGPSGELEEKLLVAYRAGASAAAKSFDETNPTRALDAIFTIVAAANDYIDKAAPWTANKQQDWARLSTIVNMLARVVEGLSLMIHPVMPTVADKLRAPLGLSGVVPNKIDQWPFEPPSRVVDKALELEAAPIFPRFDKEKEAELIARFSPPKEVAAVEAKVESVTSTSASESKPTIEFDDFAKVDLRVGIVVSAERVKKKDRLLDLRVDTGDAAPRRIVAGIAAAYAPEAIVGKRVVVLCNLAPREFGKGLVSEGMLLAGDGPDGLSVITIDAAAAPGSKVR